MFRRLIASYQERRLRNASFKEQDPFFWMMQRKDSKVLSFQDQRMLQKLRDCCPTLIRISQDAIEHFSAKDLGTLLSMIYRTSMGVALVLLQGPSPIQLQAYCTQLYMFGTQNIFHLTEPDDSALMYWRPEIPIEIAAFIRDVRSERRLQTHAPGLWDENSPAFFLAACADQRSVVLDFLDTLMNELRWRITVNCYDRTRSTYTWVKMASAFFKDQDKNQLIPDPHLREVQIAIEDTDAYVPIGNRVSLDEFCKPLAPLYVPAQGDCVICSEKLTVGEENEGCVVTVCAHYFHKVCLDTWVNEAAQQASNECPLCRQELCKGRARRPA